MTGDWSTLEELTDFVRSRGLTVQVSWQATTDKVGEAFYVGRQYTEIKFSSVYWPHMTPEERFLVLAHETAHALLSPRAAHGRRWRRLCQKLGGSGEKKADISRSTMLAAGVLLR